MKIILAILTMISILLGSTSVSFSGQKITDCKGPDYFNQAKRGKNVDISYPRLPNRNLACQIRKWINDDFKSLITDRDAYEYEANSIVYDSSPKIKSVVVSIFANAGGAHGSNYCKTFLCDIEAGKILGFSELFESGTDWPAIIGSYVKKQLDPAVSRRREFSADDYEKFSIDGKTLNIYYDQLGAWPGAIINIPLEKIKKYLRPEFQPTHKTPGIFYLGKTENELKKEAEKSAELSIGSKKILALSKLGHDGYEHIKVYAFEPEGVRLLGNTIATKGYSLKNITLSSDGKFYVVYDTAYFQILRIDRQKPVN
jgi:hypothetical protein